MSIEFLKNDFDKVSYLANLMTARATGLDSDNKEFIALRSELLKDPSLSKMLPSFLCQHRSLDSFWGDISNKFKTYAERRTYISQAFTPILDTLEFGVPFEPTQSINQAVENKNQAIKEINQKTKEKNQATKEKNQITQNHNHNQVIQNGHINITQNTTQSAQSTIARNKRKVFIVHGRDEAAEQKVSRFIQQLGLEPIVLHENANLGMTIIEKIEHYSNDVDFAIIIYTACDHGRGAHESTIPLRNRARQNVVFEHGYLMAKLGRKNVCPLVKGDIETPNDISGAVYVELDNHDGWKNRVARELVTCGYTIKSLI